MDLQLYLRVLWRFRLLVLAGLLVALVLAFVSFVRVDLDGSPSFRYREQEEFVSYATLLVTPQEFIWGNTVDKIVPSETESGEEVPLVLDEARFTRLAEIYAALATSDEVAEIMAREGPIEGTISAVPVVPQGGTESLPFVSLAGIAGSPDAAVSLARRGATAFQEYLREKQVADRTPADKRVKVEMVNEPVSAAVWENRSMTRPLIIFLTVMVAVLALAFILENFRPRVRSLPVVEHEDVRNTRRSA
jgi:hypothetical protein